MRALLLLALLAAGPALAAFPYQVQDLSPTDQDPILYANAVNNLGVAAGYTDPSGILRYESWQPLLFQNGVATTQHILPNTYYGEINGINDRGQAVGWSTNDNGPVPGVTRATLFYHDIAINLGALPGASYSVAAAINQQGIAAGLSDLGPNILGTHAVMFAQGLAIDLGTLPGAQFGVATAINDLNQVVGYASDFLGNTQAALFVEGKVTPLGYLPGGSSYSAAYGINNQGQIVGAVALANGDTRAGMFENGTWHDLGTLPGQSLSVAMAVNNFGQAVGNSYGVATLFENGTVEKLPDLPGGCDFSGASAINDRGQIVGFCSFSPNAGLIRPVIWTLAHQYVPPLPARF